MIRRPPRSPLFPSTTLFRSLGELRPARVMGQVTGHERDVEIARLANRLAVVEALEHRQQPGMLLHRTRERVEVTRTGVARQRGPGGKRLARRGNGSIHIRLTRLRDPRQSRSRGGGGGGGTPPPPFPGSAPPPG